MPVPLAEGVIIETREVNDEIEIRVSDNGYGIAPAIRDKIFDPFFTTKPVGKGTGLGLSISYGIVKDHGGVIDFESFPGSRHPVYDPHTRRVSWDGPLPLERCRQGAGTPGPDLNPRWHPDKFGHSDQCLVDLRVIESAGLRGARWIAAIPGRTPPSEG